MIFNRLKRPAPRLAPELDDRDLGRVCHQLDVRNNARARPLTAPLAERLLKDAGRDWDRRAHRLAVLAAVTRPHSQYSWIEQAPDSPEAQTLFAWGAMVRGTQHPLPHDEMNTALNACHSAARLEPSDPNPWVARLALLRQWRRPPQEVFPLRREITTRDPWHREAHLQMFGYLSPGEYGSHAQALEFVDQVRSSAPATAPTAALGLHSLLGRYFGIVSQSGTKALMADHFWSSHEADQILSHGVTEWTRPGHLVHAEAIRDLNFLAFALIAAKQTSVAAPVFQAVRGLVTDSPWNHEGQDPVVAFMNAQDRSDPPR
ncbi:hypothetical protein [Streptomyces arenae]|uniref:hypothetical protein n=1 Tax=Streptomyces arenae TaxID=29301 RepID=UPI00265AF5D0|nr:hypothetical protein [Streptomyces arenae]MCG7205088.1 hypothetical protein [Streptomyces arenae]